MRAVTVNSCRKDMTDLEETTCEQDLISYMENYCERLESALDIHLKKRNKKLRIFAKLMGCQDYPAMIKLLIKDYWKDHDLRTEFCHLDYKETFLDEKERRHGLAGRVVYEKYF